jgi:hypothetical protein
MKKLSKLLDQLIELSSVIKQIENRSPLVEIISSDLDIFYEFSIMNVTDIEKAITESLIENALDKHNIILNSIKEKLIIYNDFLYLYEGILEKINLRSLIENKLSSTSLQIESTKKELKPIDNKLYDLKSTISASAYNNPESITEKLVEQEIILKNEAEPIRKKYIELQKQKREQGNLKAIKYSQINFNKIADNFKTAITLCKVESDISVSKTEYKYVKFSIILQIHEAFELELFKNISPESLHKLFNLSDENLFYKIPDGCDTKFYYLIRILNEDIKKNTHDNWKGSIINKLEIKESIYTSNNKKILKSRNSENIAFVKKINNIFLKN